VLADEAIHQSAVMGRDGAEALVSPEQIGPRRAL
jgi:hypothetical protein